jgi:hypothetical protein
VGLSQLLFVVAGLALGIFVPKSTVPPTVSSGRIVDLLFTAGVTVISLITVIYSLLFVVVQWVGRERTFDQDPLLAFRLLADLPRTPSGSDVGGMRPAQRGPRTSRRAAGHRRIN